MAACLYAAYHKNIPFTISFTHLFSIPFGRSSQAKRQVKVRSARYTNPSRFNVKSVSVFSCCLEKVILIENSSQESFLKIGCTPKISCSSYFKITAGFNIILLTSKWLSRDVQKTFKTASRYFLIRKWSVNALPWSF